MKKIYNQAASRINETREKALLGQQLEWADGEFRYFLLMVDLYTRLIEVMPLHDQSYDSVRRAFEQGWIYQGHGVPEVVLTDQGSQLDGKDFREFCNPLGIDKRHTTPYHPQCDGMAERNVGLVKQVIRCLMLERHLDKGSWPAILKEVSFNCNMVNESSRNSPFMLTYGRQLRSQVDACCHGLEVGKCNSHGHYLDELKREQAELNAIAEKNVAHNLKKAREHCNKGRVSSDKERRHSNARERFKT